MRLAITITLSTFMLFTAGVAGASADPINSPRVSSGTIVCNGITYTVISPNNAPVGQMLTANGSDSTQVNIMIVDKAGGIPQDLLTLCMAYPPAPDEPFQYYALITPVL